MKLVTFDDGLVGRIADENVVEFDAPSMREYFERDGYAGGVRETGRVFALADVRLRAPIMPKKFFHTAGNFREHHEDLVRVDWSHPVNKGIVFFQNVDAIIGPGDDIVYPENLTRELDYELEMAIVIGRPGKFFSAAQAADLSLATWYSMTSQPGISSAGRWNPEYSLSPRRSTLSALSGRIS